MAAYMANRSIILKILSSASLSIVVMGCGKTHYELAAPGEMRGRLSEGSGVPTRKDDVEYEVFQSGGHAVISFINRTPATLRLTSASSIADATGRTFALEAAGDLIVPDQADRVLIPPTNSAERASLRPSSPTEIQPRVGGFDEGGLVTRDRLASRDASADVPRGFRWGDGQRVRVHLVFESQPIATTANPPRSPSGSITTITHDFVLRRTGG